MADPISSSTGNLVALLAILRAHAGDGADVIAVGLVRSQPAVVLRSAAEILGLLLFGLSVPDEPAAALARAWLPGVDVGEVLLSALQGVTAALDVVAEHVPMSAEVEAERQRRMREELGGS